MKKVELSTLELAALIRSVKDTLAIDNSRPPLTFIKLVVTHTTITAISCNGYACTRYVLQHENLDGDEFTAFIKPIPLKPLRTLGTVVISLQDSLPENPIFKAYVRADLGITNLIVPTPDGTITHSYANPDYSFKDEPLFEQVKEGTVYACHISASLLRSAASSFSPDPHLHHDSIKVLTPKDPLKPVLFTATRGNAYIEQLVLPIRSND